ncbi:hypothetical protein DAI22_06g240806 [Oryza sativa Japonica Group]|nr:hypothetical protein DAI22_06g240806 [Oryza sativa Japonica Group]
MWATQGVGRFRTRALVPALLVVRGGAPPCARAGHRRRHRREQPRRHVRARLQPPQRVGMAGAGDAGDAVGRHLPPQRGRHGDAERDARGGDVPAARPERAPGRRGAPPRRPRREAHPTTSARGRAAALGLLLLPRLAAADAATSESAVDTHDVLDAADAPDSYPSSSSTSTTTTAPAATRLRWCRDARKFAPCTLASHAAHRNAASASQCTAAAAPQSAHRSASPPIPSPHHTTRALSLSLSLSPIASRAVTMPNHPTWRGARI